MRLLRKYPHLREHNKWMDEKKSPKMNSCDRTQKRVKLKDSVVQNISLCCEHSVSIEWLMLNSRGRTVEFGPTRACTYFNELFNLTFNNVREQHSTCSRIVFGAVAIIDVFLSDIKLWQSDGVHLHRVPRLPHELQVVCGVADWVEDSTRSNEILLCTNMHAFVQTWSGWVDVRIAGI